MEDQQGTGRASPSPAPSVTSSTGHKRSKSSIALARLSTFATGGKNKSSDKLAPSPTVAASPTTASSSTLLTPGGMGKPTDTGSIRSTGSGSSKIHKRSKSRQPADDPVGSKSTPSIISTAADSVTSLPTPTPQPKPVTIEDSIRTFRLFEALRAGDEEAITNYLETSPDPSNVLLLAVQCAELSTIQFILSSTSRDSSTTDKTYLDINQRDPTTGNTPLHFAAHLGRTPIIHLLLTEPSINDAIPNLQGAQPVDLARTPEIATALQVSRDEYLESRLADLHKLIVTHQYGDLERFLEVPRTRALLDLNAHDGGVQGSTLLHEAARNRDIKLIQILLLHGADPFRRDKKGKLPQDITKDEKTRAVLKRSPAAVAAQNSIQEKAVLGSGAGLPGAEETSRDGTHREGREMKGYLKKWTNYTGGYKLRWFVLENGVMSYYKHQDDMESACRGAINMKIAQLYMDPQDKTRFEILGKSSVKYHLKANHQVEAKRWYWALNNAIRWAKDEANLEAAKAAEKRGGPASARLGTPASIGSTDRLSVSAAGDSVTDLPAKPYGSARGKMPGSPSMAESSWEDISSQAPPLPRRSGVEDSPPPTLPARPGAQSAAPLPKPIVRAPPTDADDDDTDDDEFDDALESDSSMPAGSGSASGGRVKKMSEPVFHETYQLISHSTKLQLDMLSATCAALLSETTKNPAMPISDPKVMDALGGYESAINNLRSLAGELFRLCKEREGYWKGRVEREVELRRLWEENMTRLAIEQEELEGRMSEVQQKQRRTKKVLREVLRETGTATTSVAGEGVSRIEVPAPIGLEQELQAVLQEEKSKVEDKGKAREDPEKQKENEVPAITPITRKKTIIAAKIELSDTDEGEASDEEFFDAVDAGEIEVQKEMPLPQSISEAAATAAEEDKAAGGDEDVEEVVRDAVRRNSESIDETEKRLVAIKRSFRGYEAPPRFKFDKSADDRPKISLWGILKSMIGKDMTKMTLPVSFNECTSLLQRVAEDMEYTDLLDNAAERQDSLERLVYVAAFAASEYSSTINRIAKPFNPLLGETYEYARPDKGFRFYIEQVSHHPPVGAAWAEAPRWDYYGESSVRAKFYGKSFDINPLGTWFLNLRPVTGGEELYTWKKVNTAVIGIITGSPTVDNYGPMEIKNWTTGEVCILDFKARGWRNVGAYEVKGRVLDKDGYQRWSIGGRWNDKLYARLSPGYDAALTGGEVSGGVSKSFSSTQAFLLWETHERPSAPFNLTPFAISLNYLAPGLKEHLCPTDTRLRPDQRAMEDGQYDFAADEKLRLEEKQRGKRRERETRGESFKPRWFEKKVHEVTGEEYWWSSGDYWRVRDKVGKGEGGWDGVEDIF